jgi:hypothetical protein
MQYGRMDVTLHGRGLVASLYLNEATVASTQRRVECTIAQRENSGVSSIDSEVS